MFLPPLPQFPYTAGMPTDGKVTKIDPGWWICCSCISSQLSSSKHLQASRSRVSTLQLSAVGAAYSEVQRLSWPSPRRSPLHSGISTGLASTCQKPPTTSHTQLQLPWQQGPGTVLENKGKGGIWHHLMEGFWEICGLAVIWDVLKYPKLNTLLKYFFFSWI